MKTEINLADYVFGSKPNLIKRQIKDCPESGLVRVIELQRAELLFDVDVIHLNALTYYVDTAQEKVIHKFTQQTLLEKKPWLIEKGVLTIKLDDEFKPMPNPDFNKKSEVNYDNYPFILTDSYEQFSNIILNPDIDKSLASLFIMFVDANDSKNLHD